MNHEEQRQYLIRTLLDEEPEYRNYQIPEGEQEQKDLLRALMNVRMPKMISKTFLEIQDEYLQEEIRRTGITDIDDLKPVPYDQRIYLWQGDITQLRADAITNPANSALLGCFRPLHNCADNCIHTYAGIQLRAECAQKMRELRLKYGDDYEQPTAVPMLTSGYNLPAKHVIHVVGPIVQGRLTGEHERLLAECYRNCLEMAEDHHLESIAFCCISTGVFMFPNKRAAEIAVKTVTDWLEERGSRMKVIFNVFKDNDLVLYKYCLGEQEAE